MAQAWLVERMNEVDVLLDILQGEEIGSRRETQTSGPGPAGYEPCLGCGPNIAVWGYCPACNNTGFVRSIHGGHDPYLRSVEPAMGEGEDAALDSYAGAQPIAHHPIPEEQPERQRVLDRIFHPRVAIPTTEQEDVKLTGVERAANARMNPRVLRSLRVLVRLLAKCPPEIRRGALVRDPEALEYLAKRAGKLEIPA